MLVKQCGLLHRLRIMPDDKQEMTREERLAAKLRENLRRRKTQAREIEGEPGKEKLAKGVSES